MAARRSFNAVQAPSVSQREGAQLLSGHDVADGLHVPKGCLWGRRKGCKDNDAPLSVG